MRRDSTTAEPLLASPEPAAHYGTLPTADPDAAPPSSSPSKQSAAAETDLVAGTGSEHLGPYGGVIISLDKDPDAELPLKRTPWQQLKHVLQFVGAGSLIAVGYMDPGNWAANLKAGSSSGYTLLFAILFSSCLAVCFQVMCVKLGLSTGKDLAQLSREHLPKWTRYPLWLLIEIAIIATDMAEVIGSAIALNLLFGLYLPIGVAITAVDSFIVLFGVQDKLKYLEYGVIVLVLSIAAMFIALLVQNPPPYVGELFLGFLPSAKLIENDNLFVLVSILGATCMPHSLYLHSYAVKDFSVTAVNKKSVVQSTFWDTLVSLFVAFIVNCSILLVAAVNFYYNPNIGELVDGRELQDAYGLLSDVLGKPYAIIFAVALLLAGQSSTVTGTLAGSVVMQGFVDLKIKPVFRRLITRAAAIIPALVAVLVAGEAALGELLVWSQVILSLVLPFGIIPLVMFVTNPNVVGPENVLGRVAKVFAWIGAALVSGVNVYLIVDFARKLALGEE